MMNTNHTRQGARAQHSVAARWSLQVRNFSLQPVLKSTVVHDSHVQQELGASALLLLRFSAAFAWLLCCLPWSS